MSWLIVRVRSDVNVEHTIKDTMHHLNLTKVNHATIVPQRPQDAGMLQKAKDYITWGEVSAETIEAVLRQRGRLSGDSPLTDEYVAENSDFKDITAFSAALASGEAVIKDMPELNKRGIAVRYLAFPRSGIGTTTSEQMESVWCATNRAKAMNEAKQGMRVSKKSCANPVSRQFTMGRDMGVRGTPAIFTEHGQSISGYMLPDKLLQALNSQ